MRILLFAIATVLSFSLLSCGDKKTAETPKLSGDSTKPADSFDPSKFSYALGMLVGENLTKSFGLDNKKINVEEFCATLKSSMDSAVDRNK